MLFHKPQPANRSILLAPPTNAFSGLLYAARTRQVFLAAVAFAAILSESLGILLSNIPFQVTLTFLVYQISAWAAVGILSLMIFLVVLSFWVKWPPIPVDPSTIAGAMYYLSDSPLVERMESLGMLGGKELDARVVDLGLSYGFGDMIGVSGYRRIGIHTS
jgi:hypothetical protein